MARVAIQFGTPGWRVGSVGELFNEDKIILGGEGPAGWSIKGHYSEKDGRLARLLSAEALATQSTSSSTQLVMLLPKQLEREPGNGRRCAQVKRMDGVRLTFADRLWLYLRPAGTKPLVRVYAAWESDTEMEVLLEQGRKYLLGR